MQTTYGYVVVASESPNDAPHTVTLLNDAMSPTIRYVFYNAPLFQKTSNVAILRTHRLVFERLLNRINVKNQKSVPSKFGILSMRCTRNG